MSVCLCGSSATRRIQIKTTHNNLSHLALIVVHRGAVFTLSCVELLYIETAQHDSKYRGFMVLNKKRYADVFFTIEMFNSTSHLKPGE